MELSQINAAYAGSNLQAQIADAAESVMNPEGNFNPAAHSVEGVSSGTPTLAAELNI